MAITSRLTDFVLTHNILPGASALCWLHQSMTGLPRFDLSKSDARSSSSLTYADPLIKYPSRRSILLHTNDMAEPAQPLDINTLHNVSMSLRSSYSSLLKRMRKSLPTRIGPKILCTTFLSNTLKAAASVLNNVHAFCAMPEARVA